LEAHADLSGAAFLKSRNQIVAFNRQDAGFIWSVLPDAQSTSHLRHLAALLNGEGMEAVQRLGISDLIGTGAPVTDSEMAAWHRHQAELDGRDSLMASAVFHLRRAVALCPEDEVCRAELARAEERLLATPAR
jgi:hypothetical protein